MTISLRHGCSFGRLLCSAFFCRVVALMTSGDAKSAHRSPKKSAPTPTEEEHLAEAVQKRNPIRAIPGENPKRARDKKRPEEPPTYHTNKTVGFLEISIREAFSLPTKVALPTSRENKQAPQLPSLFVQVI